MRVLRSSIYIGYQRRWRMELIAVFILAYGRTTVVFQPCKGIIRSTEWQLKLGKFNLGIRCSFLAVTIIKLWNSSIGEVMDSSLLEIFKLRLVIFCNRHILILLLGKIQWPVYSGDQIRWSYWSLLALESMNLYSQEKTRAQTIAM